MQHLRWHWEQLTRLVLEGQCPLCDRSTAQTFCPSCQRQLQQCQLAHHQWSPTPVPLFAWGSYRGALKRAIGALKYHGNPHLAEPLATWLADAWLATPNPQTQQGLTVIPIPMHPDKQKQRGFNQAERLATHFCRITRLPCLVNGLSRDRETIAQFHLSAAERQQNLQAAFKPSKTLLNQRFSGSVLLLDDIYTTGATIQAATQALHRCGIRVSEAIVLAKAVKEKGGEGWRMKDEG